MEQETMQAAATTAQTTDPKAEAMSKLYAALSAFQGSLQQPEKNKEVTVRTQTGGNYKFKYADLGNCFKSARQGLADNGLCVIQAIEGDTLVTTLAHKDGGSISSTIPVNLRQAPQAVGSTLTYFKRYAYCALLGIVADDDDDANAAMGNQAQVNNKAARVASLTQHLQQLKQDPDYNPVLLKALEAIVAAKNIEELGKIFNDNAAFQDTAVFMSFLSTRKKELK